MSIDTVNKIATMPLLALRGLVMFPHMVLTFDVGRKKSAEALNAAMASDRTIFLVTQKDISVDEPTKNDLYEIGCVAKIRQVFKISDNVVKVLVEGLYRAKLVSCFNLDEHIVCSVTECEIAGSGSREIYKEALVRKIRSQLQKYAEVAPNIAPDVMMTVANNSDIGFLSDFIAFNVPAPFDDKQYILEQLSPVKRAKVLLEMLDKERKITEIDNKISENTKVAIDDNQREYYLREQLRVISNELYGDETFDEVEQYRDKIVKLNADDNVKSELMIEVNKLAKMPQGSHEATVVRDYLDECLSLPWNKKTKTITDVHRAERILNRDFYGMKKVKERILEMLSVYAVSPDIKGQIICLVGPPGVGKTSICKTVAECMGRKFVRVSLGGIHDEAEIRGHRRTYIGSMPGKIIKAVKQAGSSNPLILLDEIDKLGNDYKGDPSSALLEVLDPEQNNTFTDHFIEIPYDLSSAVFITTANYAENIPAPLYDRMEIIELPSYTREEKFNITKKHLLGKELKRHGLTQKNCRICDSALYEIIDSYTREAGVRNLERNIASLCRKAAKRIAEKTDTRVVIKGSDIEKFLGAKKFKPERILEKDEVGIINGLAWTAVGGEIMQLEVAVMDGTGKVELTGSLGDVMKESAHAAISYVRANAKRYGIDGDFYKTKDIHIHATEAAVPKDGPSAGVTITTGIVSALTGAPVKREVAMTGEITILGRVLPIGGLREKAMAAYRGGVKKIFIPKDNISDIEEIDDIVKENILFVPVSHVDEIIKEAIVLPQTERIVKTVGGQTRTAVYDAHHC